MRLGLFVTCLGDTLFPEVGQSLVRLLERLGHQVEFPEEQTCCGQMHFNTGYAEDGLALARRFHELVGEPPMSFLAGWRIALAADLLREPGATIGSVAHQVGYGSPYALSTAFKRVRGVSPKQHRAMAA